MSAQITINPQLLTNAAGTFGVDWNGGVQGFYEPDAAIRNFLTSGFLASSETLPMWGGVGISEAVPTPPGSPPSTPQMSQGGPITRATNVTGGSTAGNLTGFSVFDQGYGMINTPQSPVPQVATYGQVPLFRLGSGARIWVAMAPVLVDLYGDPITEQVSWDFIAQQLIPYQAAYAANVVTASSWSGGDITYTTTSAHGVSVGSVVEFSGFTPTGYNGQFTTITGTTGSTIVVAAANPGASTVQGTLVAGGGALPCKVLKVEPSNSMTVNYNAGTGFITWNYNAPACLIQI